MNTKTMGPKRAGEPVADVHAGAAVGMPLDAGFPSRPEAARRSRFWRDALLRRMLGLADLASAGVITAMMVTGASLFVWPLALLPAWILLAKVLGLYDGDHRGVRHSTVDELPTIVVWAAGTAAGLALLLPLILDSSLAADDSLGRALGAAGEGDPAGGFDPPSALLAALVGAVTAGVLRGCARSLWRRLTPPESTLLLGDDDLAAAIQRKIDLFPDLHINLDEQLPLPQDAAGAMALDPFLQRIDRVLVATDALRAEWIEELAVRARAHHVKLSVISPLRGRAAAAPRVSKLADLSVLEYNTWDVSRSSLVLKRAFDLVVAAVGLVVCLPLMAVIACVIKLESPGPIFFGQRRAGLRGRAFTMLKFRTMLVDAEANLHELVILEELRDPCFKLADDPRVTRVGRALRRFSLDELPQLVNVLRGEMSIVGPRPEQLELVERYRPEHRFRLAVKPGITGPMQVSGRGALSFPERLAVELDYVENLSIWQDLRILAHTIVAVSRGTGAY